MKFIEQTDYSDINVAFTKRKFKTS